MCQFKIYSKTIELSWSNLSFEFNCFKLGELNFLFIRVICQLLKNLCLYINQRTYVSSCTQGSHLRKTWWNTNLTSRWQVTLSWTPKYFLVKETFVRHNQEQNSDFVNFINNCIIVHWIMDVVIAKSFVVLNLQFSKYFWGEMILTSSNLF